MQLKYKNIYLINYTYLDYLYIDVFMLKKQNCNFLSQLTSSTL